MDQPYVFEVSKNGTRYRLEFHDTESPENWRLLQPDVVILCYDISRRESFVHMQKSVHCPPYPIPRYLVIIFYSTCRRSNTSSGPTKQKPPSQPGTSSLSSSSASSATSAPRTTRTA